MTDTPTRPSSTDLTEPSPSTGWRETAVILDAPNAYAVEPVEQDTDTDQPPAADAPSFEVTA